MMDDNNKSNLKNDNSVFHGDANAIETLNHSVDSHNVSTTNNYYVSESEEQKRVKNKTAYRDYCRSRIKDGLISPQLRRELDDYAFSLSLSVGEKQEIELGLRFIPISLDASYQWGKVGTTMTRKVWIIEMLPDAQA